MQKIKTKKIILILLLIILAFCFCGCAMVRAVTITNQDGSIEEMVFVSLNENEVLNSGYNISTLKKEITLTAKEEASQIVERLNNKILTDSLSATDDTKEILKTYKNGITVYSSVWKDNNYLISIKFKNIDVYCYYYGINQNSKLETKTEKHFLYDKVSFGGSTMFLKHNELYQKINNQFSLKYMGLVNSDTNQLLYTYTTNLRRQHSNADYVNRYAGQYYHTWIVEDVENEEIIFHYNIANAGNWILIAIVVSLLVCGTLFIVYFIKEKHKKLTKNTD